MIKKKRKEYYDFSDLVKEVNEKLGIDQREAGKYFHPDTGNFKEWHKEKGYPDIDPDGKIPDHSQIWFKEYGKDCQNGKWKDTPYLDFWHFQIDNLFMYDVSNDSMNSLYVGIDDPDWDCKFEPWQLEIQKVYHELFYDLSVGGWIEVHLSW